MFIVTLAGDHLYGKCMAVHLAVACDVFGGVLFYAVIFPFEMSWMRSGNELSQFLRSFPTYSSINFLAIHISLLCDSLKTWGLFLFRIYFRKNSTTD